MHQWVDFEWKRVVWHANESCQVCVTSWFKFWIRTILRAHERERNKNESRSRCLLLKIKVMKTMYMVQSHFWSPHLNWLESKITPLVPQHLDPTCFGLYQLHPSGLETSQQHPNNIPTTGDYQENQKDIFCRESCPAWPELIVLKSSRQNWACTYTLGESTQARGLLKLTLAS